MQPEQIRELLEQVKAGAAGVDEAFLKLAELPFTDLGDAKIDNHRALRCGFAEVVLCRGKDPRDVTRIIDEGLRNSSMMLATRAEKRHVDAIKERFPHAFVNLRGGTVRIGQPVKLKARGSVMVVTAGTGDIPVAEEALETLRAFGCDGYHCYDVGVAGLHRVLAALPQIQQAAVVICVAGMDGALPSVLGGLVQAPVIAVPTSIGYGASFGGVAAMLGMLNSCSGGVSVVNIDNGFGAALIALKMITDRDYSLIEAFPKASAENVTEALAPVTHVQALEEQIEEKKSEASVARDAQIDRLEKAVEQLIGMTNKAVVVEAPKIEINQPDHSEHIARLEKSIAELAAIVSNQKELIERQGEQAHAALSARFDRSVEQLAAAVNRPVIVELKHSDIQKPPAAVNAPEVAAEQKPEVALFREPVPPAAEDAPPTPADLPPSSPTEKSDVVKGGARGKKTDSSARKTRK